MQYQIQGETLPVVICQLSAGERMITEGGGMAWMSPNMKMETTSNGGLGRALGRMFSGEKMFQNIYTAQGGPGMIAFASSFPGSVKAFQIAPGQELVFQKSAFLASEAGVQLSVHFQKKLGSGLFGGEGFTGLLKRTLFMLENMGVTSHIWPSASSTQAPCAIISQRMTPGTTGLPGKWPFRNHSSPLTWYFAWATPSTTSASCTRSILSRCGRIFLIAS